MPPPPAPTKPLRILMLHGYTQSGPLFRAKTRALEKHLAKAFPSGASLVYPTAPHRLSPADIPVWDNSAPAPVSTEPLDCYAWWTRADTNPPTYTGLAQGLARVAECLKTEGPFDGVVGFSQGGALAGMVASLLETGRPEAFGAYAESVKSGGKWWAGGLEKWKDLKFDADTYPASFLNADGTVCHAPMKFAAIYSGFKAPHPAYGAYFSPKIATPTVHFLGSVDTVVVEDRSLALVDVCVEPRIVRHPGGHFLPASQKEWVGALIAFMRESLESKVDKKEERVEDMELPF
ncbi:dihydrofolate reductase-like protein [Microthyrium microscopicum]|uniref:Dihydrofolate reductase-like protein n=1 Tax=Microthyrium microscopicum TaxID=703497 RepID=A0A6A6URF0_9PEZI|nr:dihydrofolate reductase-like protein [Microthyrium microscopicum]